MTTLPQTTAIRVSRPAGPTAMAVGQPHVVGAAVAAPQSQFHMTAGDAWRVVRQHIWLIVLMTIFSAVLGWVVNTFVLARYYSRYTSMALIQITPSSPMSGTMEKEATLDPTTLSIEQKTQANLLLQESFLLNCLRSRE